LFMQAVQNCTLDACLSLLSGIYQNRYLRQSAFLRQ